jgi:predicted membrane protein
MKNHKKQSGCLGKSTGFFFGLIVMLAGTILLAFNLGWLDSQFRSVVFSWPMIFVFFTIVSLFNRNYFSMLVFLALSTFFLLPRIAKIYPDALPWIESDFAANYWPVLIIFVGICIIFGLFSGKGMMLFVFGNSKKDAIFSYAEGVESTDGFYKRKVAFGGAEDVFLEPVFRGGEIQAAFGGVELDLRKTTLPEGDTRLDINVAFGGLEVRVPENWKVINDVSVALGHIECRQNQQTAEVDGSRRRIVTGNVAFGGCEIR